MIYGILFIFLSVLSSVTVAHVLRYVKKVNTDITHIITVNYLIAFIIAFPFADFTSTSLRMVMIGILTGIIYIANFYVFAAALKQNSIGLSVTTMRLSVIIPIAGSIFLFDENVSLAIGIGISLVFVAFVFLIPKDDSKTESRGEKAPFLLLLLFVLSGFGDFAAKFFDFYRSVNDNPYTFMSIVFGTSFLIGSALSFNKKGNFNTKIVIQGVALGIPNLFSGIFLLFALQSIPVVIVYPAVNSSVIVLASVSGILLWKDQLTYQQWTGLSIAIFALFFLL